MQRREARASTIFAKLKNVGVTHVVGLPDNASAPLFRLVQHDIAIQLVSVTREGEAFAIASGLWIGGKLPIVLIQNTGLLESGDSLRGTASRMGVPLLILVTCRGWARREPSPTTSPPSPVSREMLVRADLDSVAFMTEPTLNAWGVPFSHYASDDDLRNLDAMWQIAQQQERPSALLITHSLT